MNSSLNITMLIFFAKNRHFPVVMLITNEVDLALGKNKKTLL